MYIGHIKEHIYVVLRLCCLADDKGWAGKLVKFLRVIYNFISFIPATFSFSIKYRRKNTHFKICCN